MPDSGRALREAPAESVVDELYLGTLSRLPTSLERNEALAFVTESAGPREAYAGILWMLLNRSEFMLLR